MNNVVVKLKKNLNAIILRTAKEKKRFLYLPNKDFTRKGKISFQVLLKLIFSMVSGFLGKNYWSISLLAVKIFQLPLLFSYEKR